MDRDYSERESGIFADREERILQGEKKTGFQKILKTEYPQMPIEMIEIREGRSREELDEIFKKMYGAA